NSAPDTTDNSTETGTQLSRIAALPALGKSAYEQNTAPVAAGYAAELLAVAAAYPTQYKSTAIFHANLIAGRVALHSGDAVSAAAFLLAAGKAEDGLPAPNVLTNMQLARDLLKSGQQNAVIAYLSECKRFWNAELLDHWIADIQHGRTPNF